MSYNIYTTQSAGSMSIKTGDDFVSGYAYVYDGSTWHKGKEVYIKSSDRWEESV